MDTPSTQEMWIDDDYDNDDDKVVVNIVCTMYAEWYWKIRVIQEENELSSMLHLSKEQEEREEIKGLRTEI